MSDGLLSGRDGSSSEDIPCAGSKFRGARGAATIECTIECTRPGVHKNVCLGTIPSNPIPRFVHVCVNIFTLRKVNLKTSPTIVDNLSAF